MLLVAVATASGCGLGTAGGVQRGAGIPPVRPQKVAVPEPTAARCKVDRLDRPAPAHHVMRRGDTLYSVARIYGVKLSDLLALNPIADPTVIPVGTKIALPPTARSPWGGKRMVWPVRGTITSRFKASGRRHDGIDVAAPRGTPVKAAADGVVELSGKGLDGFSGYGRIVLIRHGSGLRTLYAHTSKVFVRPGQCVARGQEIAEVGSSGNATGPHLHFEVQRAGRSIDPLYFLP